MAELDFRSKGAKRTKLCRAINSKMKEFDRLLGSGALNKSDLNQESMECAGLYVSTDGDIKKGECQNERDRDDGTASLHYISHKIADQNRDNNDEDSSSENSDDGTGSQDENGNDSDNFNEGSIAMWALEGNISHQNVRKLLKIIKSHPCHRHWPSDPRTLFGTVRHVNVKSMPPGCYYHFGLENGLLQFMVKENYKKSSIMLAFGIDGLSLSKSSGSQFWPILCMVKSVKSKPIFLVGLYHGYAKPSDSNVFLSDLVAELVKLDSGIKTGNSVVKIEVSTFICDAPAKSYILNTKSHTGYSSCTKCTIHGQYEENRVCFLDCECPSRTNEDFLRQKDDDHHTGFTILTQIPNFDIINNFPIDYMHNTCLGVMKRLLQIWMQWGKGNSKISHSDIKKMSLVLEQWKDCWPSDFARNPRSMNEVHRWKATEFRKFLLYLGPILLRKCFRLLEADKRFVHFLVLHVAMRILTSPQLIQHVIYAKNLLTLFVEKFSLFYGNHMVSYNVHGLIHIADDAGKHGTLDEFSAFPYESFMQPLRRMVRKAEKPLHQVVRRVSEGGVFLAGNEKKSAFEENLATKLNLSDKSNRDNCCLLKDGSVVVITKLPSVSGCEEGHLLKLITGKRFLSKRNLYENPCASSILNTYEVENLSKKEKTWPLHDVAVKMVCLPIEKARFVVIPLLHN